MFDEGGALVVASAGSVGSDVAVGCCPKRMVGRERFGVGDVEVGGGKLSVGKCVSEGVVVEGCAAPDVVEPGGGFAGGEAAGIEVVLRAFVVGKEVDDVVGFGEGGSEFFFGNDVDAGFADCAAAEGEEAHVEGGEEAGEVAGDGAVAEDEGGFAVEEPGAGEVFEAGPGSVGELVFVGDKQPSREGEHHGEDVLGAGFGEDAGDVGEADAAGAEFLEDGFVAGVAGGGDGEPTEFFGAEEVVGVGLSDGDICVGKGVVDARRREEFGRG